MKIEELKEMVSSIVKDAVTLKNRHTNETSSPVNYVCIFCHDLAEYESIRIAAEGLGPVIVSTETGPIFKIAPLQTLAGMVQLLKVRLPDVSRPERGDADFTVSNYSQFKARHLSKAGFKLIRLDNAEMIELVDSDFEVRAYFSNPPLDQELGLATS